LVDCIKGRAQIRLTSLQPPIPVEQLFIIECQPYPTNWAPAAEIAADKIVGAAVMEDNKEEKATI
jgi:hypothetical protein